MRQIAHSVVLVSICWAGIVGAEPVDADELIARLEARLPERIRTESKIIFQDESLPSQRHVLMYTPDWSRVDQWRQVPDLGENIILAGTNDGETMSTFFGDSQRIEIRESTPSSLHVDGPARLVPMPILNAIRASRSVDKIESHPDGETYSFDIPELLGGTYFEIDVREDRITAFRRGRSADQISSEVTYEEYKKLDNGRELPRLITKTTQQPEPGSAPIKFETRITEVEEIAPDLVMPTLMNIPGVTIVDRIEGVTRRADGSVIGLIESESNLPPAKSSGGIPLNTILTWGGVALVLGAAFIYVRRARATGA